MAKKARKSRKKVSAAAAKAARARLIRLAPFPLNSRGKQKIKALVEAIEYDCPDGSLGRVFSVKKSSARKRK